jgi:hypothetical protein
MNPCEVTAFIVIKDFLGNNDYMKPGLKLYLFSG